MTLRLCTICARGGSKGVPKKNIRPLNGKPLIAYSIEHALNSGLFHKIAVSSDCEGILETSKIYGADILIKRPDEMATDSAGKLDAIRHAILETEKQTGKKYSTFVDLSATSPIRISDDIKLAVETLETEKISSVLTVSPAKHSPYFSILEINEDNEVTVSKKTKEQILSRQASPKCYDMNGSIYVWSRQPFLSEPSCFYKNTKLLIMPEKRSVDIDSELDFEIAEIIIRNNSYKENESFAL